MSKHRFFQPPFIPHPDDGLFLVRTVGKTLEWTKITPPPIDFIFDSINVTLGQSTPPSVLITGQILSNNSGIRAQGTPVYVQLGGEIPQLVALSDAVGKFNIRIYIRDKDISFSLCQGGNFSSERLLTEGRVQRYSLTRQVQAALKSR
jgi:hypothetical protein